MSSNMEGTATVAQNREVIVSFAPERLRAPFFLRCGALLLDYLLIIATPVIFLLLARLSGYDGVRLLGSEWNTTGWLIAVLIAAANLVLLPALTGQSVGKIAAGIRIVNLDGSPPAAGRILVRQTVGYLLAILSLGIGFLISAFNNKGRAVQDFIAGTVIIHADRNIRKV